MINRQIVLASRPRGIPDLSNFRLAEASIPRPKEGEVVVRSLYLSVDPYMRGRMGGRPSSHPPFEIDRCIEGDGVGRVAESKNPQFKAGDLVAGRLEWADYSVGRDLRKIDPPMTIALGALGMTGMTAYFGLLDIGQPKAGETVVVSGAAGAVGIMVGQIAKIQGCAVVGIAGSEAKKNYLLHELGFDAAVNYKDPDFAKKLSEACPAGVDIYFDNVGGSITEQALKLINKRARIVLCGQIAAYNLEQAQEGPSPFRTLIVKRALAQGFIVHDFKDRFPSAREQIGQWIREGRIQNGESIIEGLENAPGAFLSLFTGENRGKVMVKISCAG